MLPASGDASFIDPSSIHPRGSQRAPMMHLHGGWFLRLEQTRHFICLFLPNWYTHFVLYSRFTKTTKNETKQNKTKQHKTKTQNHQPQTAIFPLETTRGRIKWGKFDRVTRTHTFPQFPSGFRLRRSFGHEFQKTGHQTGLWLGCQSFAWIKPVPVVWGKALYSQYQ